MALPARPTIEPTANVSDDDLIARWIEPDPHYRTADRARIAEHAVSVTAVVWQVRVAGGDVAAAMDAYELPAEAVRAALAYYERHKAVIDARITLDAASFADDSIEPDTTSADELIARWIITAPAFRAPDRARIVDHGVSVTALITRLRGPEDREAVARAYHLPREAIDAAVAYYNRHRAVIDARITLNTARFAG